MNGETDEPVPECDPAGGRPIEGLIPAYAAERYGLSDLSVAELVSTIRIFGRHLNRTPAVADFTDGSLRSFLASRLALRTGATVRKDRRNLLALWRFAHRKGFTEREPRDVPFVPQHLKAPDAWSLAEIGAMVEASREAAWVKHWGPPHWEALLLTLYDSGERLGAVIRCPRTGYDRQRRTITIPGALRKGGRFDHVNMLSKQAVAAIEAILSDEHDRLFPWPRGYQSLRREFHRILRLAGIPRTRGKLFHSIRKTSYSLVWDALGRDMAARHVGHASNLERHYLDRRLISAGRGADVLPRPGLPPGGAT